MNQINHMRGSCEVKIVSAATADMLTAVARAQIELWNVQETDELTVTAHLSYAQLPVLEALLCKRGEECVVTGRKGLYWRLIRVIRRPVMLVGALLILIASLYLPTRVLFVRVEGNQTVSAYKILDCAQDCGIRMWASRADVRSEQMKNQLLMAIPQLKWAGINTKGCVAVISVTERETPEQRSVSTTPKRIVAQRDGIIKSITAVKGTPLCAVGEAVSKDQVLVSPYTDCGISIKITDVEAEIMAVTNRKLRVVKPLPNAKKGDRFCGKISVSLLLGKNIINLYNGSGNCSGVCDMIYEEHYVTLPGGFRLPLAVVTQRCISCNTEAFCERESEDLSLIAEDYLRRTMVSGSILSGSSSQDLLENCVVFDGSYSCLEMIGKLQDEGFVQNEQRS